MDERRKSKKYEELDFTDDFMFCKILYHNKQLCKELLELILGKKISRIEYHNQQKQIEVIPEGKGVRLDVYLEDERTVYDLEMQATYKRNLPKRSRYYQGMMDLNLIERGADYEELKESYVIFICKSDPFKSNAGIYTFENRCREVEGLRLGDGTMKVFLNANGDTTALSPARRNFVDYIAGRSIRGPLVSEIDEQVRKARKHEKWRTEYSTFEMLHREKYKEGLQEGRQEERIDAIQRLKKKGFDQQAILDLGYTEEEYETAGQEE